MLIGGKVFLEVWGVWYELGVFIFIFFFINLLKVVWLKILF